MIWDPITFSDMETSTQQGSACFVGARAYSFGIYVIPSKLFIKLLFDRSLKLLPSFF